MTSASPEMVEREHACHRFGGGITDHNWRLIEEKSPQWHLDETTGTASRLPDIRRWYCTRCRKVETTEEKP